MNYLLPHRFKKVGSIITLPGFALWLFMQFGGITRLLSGSLEESQIHVLNVIAASIGFFAFLAGIYFLAFAKEKIEDEMVERTRLESFQFAALVQLLFIILSFIVMFTIEEPGDSGLMLFFILSLFIFWLSFIGRFNYVLHRVK